jgi:hypothetical protein
MYAALLTWFIRRPDDGPVETETCSLPFFRYGVPEVNCFIILVIELLAHRDVFNQTSHSAAVITSILILKQQTFKALVFTQFTTKIFDPELSLSWGIISRKGFAINYAVSKLCLRCYSFEPSIPASIIVRFLLAWGEYSSGRPWQKLWTSEITKIYCIAFYMAH